MTKQPRFIVRESHGYQIDPTSDGSTRGGYTRPPTEFMVLDRGYCHRVVWSSWAGLDKYAVRARQGRARRAEDRAYADALAARLNAEDATT